MELRDYQQKAITAVLTEYDKGIRRTLVNMSTGTGKTVVFSHLYKALKSRLPGQMLVLAHTEELIDQNAAVLRAVNPSFRVDIDMAEHKAEPSGADIIIASVQTLGRKGTKRVEKYNWDRIDKVIIDEAHHSTANSYREILSYSGSLEPDTVKLLVGYTATSQRADGTPLAEIFESIAFVYSLRRAISDGWLVEPCGFRVRTQTDLTGVRQSEGDFVLSELAEVVDTEERNRNVIQAWKTLSEGLQTIVYCAGVAHAQDLAAAFQCAELSADAVWGSDPDREQKIIEFREGHTTILCNDSVLVEGFDVPSIGCIVIARPTRSPVRYTQMVGRGTRICSGKENLIVIDISDSGNHSLVTLPSLMGLPGTLDLQGKGLVYAIEKIEEEEILHPQVDFSKLTEIGQINQLIEQVNLLDVRFPEEVETNSELTWFRSIGGGYRMNLPADGLANVSGFMHIYQNLLGHWEIIGKIGGKRLRAVPRDSMEDAFKAADEQIRARLSVPALSCVKRVATWHGLDATAGQRTLLGRLYKGRVFPEQMTRGEASRLIGERVARRAK